MSIPPAIATDEVATSLTRVTTFADALDQVFKKVVVSEALMMAALSQFRDGHGIGREELEKYIAVFLDYQRASKELLMKLKLKAAQPPDP